ncbi:hypothetical protein RHABOEDO_001054 [Candidatus Rhabdochlamydia oedothoracis]|uniref:Septum formation protein Maf n=1 Tax=Candidatus Rhabdochlamydia oedothoracis TaxID=2720720 RepID=A0ABX8V0W5_9BACT|nr:MULTISPECIES: Maf family protein [Rhabdochlamydia]KAG6559138.1 Septum formation protein Maf [Candidatus Rhabdochlamydia sp. W815]QYF48829.1 hypothetical protein RHABOEDO_001054 [Candidatus Rhabdochlamydia oedothoracis]
MLILASSSPRRSEILRYFSLPFTQHSSHFDESIILCTSNLKRLT